MDNTNNTTHQPAIITDLCQQFSNILTLQSNAETGSNQKEKMTLTEMPCNAISGKQYKGINVILLWAAMREHRFASYEWATFKQWNASKKASVKVKKAPLLSTMP